MAKSFVFSVLSGDVNVVSHFSRMVRCRSCVISGCPVLWSSDLQLVTLDSSHTRDVLSRTTSRSSNSGTPWVTYWKSQGQQSWNMVIWLPPSQSSEPYSFMTRSDVVPLSPRVESLLEGLCSEVPTAVWYVVARPSTS